MMTANWALALMEQGKPDAAWKVAQADELLPETTREQWVAWATVTVAKRREPRKRRYLSCAETAKLVRTAPKITFPSIKFSVTSKTYSGGASIRVLWTDGPTENQVDAVTSAYQGADFDGMVDLKTHRPDVELDGEMVSFGADYIHCDRRYSPEFTRKVGEAYSQETGWPIPVIYDSGGFEWDNTQPVPGGYEPVAAWFNRKLWTTAEADLT